jgi:hypothetical protein
MTERSKKKNIRIAVLVAFAFLLVPFGTRAASFSQSYIFLSESSITQGDTVLVHAVIGNPATTSFSGSLLFQDNGASIGTLPISLDAGGENVFSISWTPAVGAHTITATLKDGAGTTIEKETDKVTVAAPPTSNGASLQTVPVDSSAPIQEYIADISPIAASTTEPLFSTVDSMRQGAANAIEGQIISTEPKAIPSAFGTVSQGTSSQTSPSSILWTAYLYLLTLLKLFFSNALLFYPLFVVIFLFFLWWLYKRMSRRR